MVIKVAMPGKFQFRMVPAFQTVLFQKENEIHYIGGSEVLPPPLLPDEEASAIERLGKTGSEVARLVKSFDMKVLAWDRRRKEAQNVDQVYGAENGDNLNELLKNSK